MELLSSKSQHDKLPVGSQFQDAVWTSPEEDVWKARMTVCIRVGKCWRCDILLGSFPCCWLCAAAGRRRSAAPPCRRSLAGLSLCSWSTPQSNVWGWECLCLTQIWGHTHTHTQAKGKKTDHSFSDVTISTTDVVVEHECETMDAPGVFTPHGKPAAKISPIQFPPSFSAFL